MLKNTQIGRHANSGKILYVHRDLVKTRRHESCYAYIRFVIYLITGLCSYSCPGDCPGQVILRGLFFLSCRSVFFFSSLYSYFFLDSLCEHLFSFSHGIKDALKIC